jgi:hypothetical protein
MADFRQRLRRGTPTALDQLAFRAAGLFLLASCWHFTTVLLANAPTNPAQVQDLAHLALAILAVLSLHSGLALSFLGPGLFKEYPWPVNSRCRPNAPL